MKKSNWSYWVLVLAAALLAGCATNRSSNHLPGAILRGADMPPVRDENLSSSHTAPVPLVMVNPTYPFDMRKRRESAEVMVYFVVTKTGDVVLEKVLGAPEPALEAAIRKAVARWKYKPGSVDGKPVNTRLKVPISFSPY